MSGRHFVKTDLVDSFNQYVGGYNARRRGSNADSSAAMPREYKVVNHSPDLNSQSLHFHNANDHLHEYRGNSQWPEVTPKFGNTVFEMPKTTPPSREETPPPPPIIDWHNVVDRVSTDSSLEINDDAHSKTDHNDYRQNLPNGNFQDAGNVGMDWFRNLESENDNTTDHWRSLSSGNIGEKNTSINTQDSQRFVADKIYVNAANKTLFNSNNVEGNNFGEKSVEVRALNNGKVECVWLTTKQHERYIKALRSGFNFSDALDFSMKGFKKLGLIPTNLKKNPLTLQAMQHIENTINNYAVIWSLNSKLISYFPQNGWLIILCNNDIAGMLQTQFAVIRNICKLDINLVAEGERHFPPGHIVQGYFPHSINYSFDKVMDLIQAQNDITTTLWKLMSQRNEEGSVLNITFEVDDRSWHKLQELNGLIFYRFGQITLMLEKNDDDRMPSQLSTTTEDASYCKEISINNTTTAQTVNTQQLIPNSILMKLDQLKKNIAINMKIFEHKRSLEENVI